MDGTIRLTCEFLHNPLGIQTARPRFSWYSDEPKGMQAGWRIRVAASEEDLRGGPLLWDSGPVASGRCTAIPYEGVTLESRRRYWWRLTLSLTGEDEPLESAPAWFETGILSPGEWQADWMAAPAHTYGVTDWFRRPFRLAAPPVSARLYISGIGYCEAFLNGEKIGDRLLDPGWTDYRRRVLYSVYDITPYLREGENVLGVELAEGWYGHRHESFDRFMGGQPAFQGTPRLLLEADIRLADGGRVRLLSGPAGGFSTHPGAVVENGVYDGEVYDARREQPGWACPGPVGAAWKPVEAAEPPGGVLTAQLMPPIRRLDTLTPRCLLRVADGRLVADFGRNFAGWVTMTVRGPAGAAVTVRTGETLRPDGRVNQENLRGAKSRDRYILKGEDRETWHPRFTYHGFRYAEFELPAGVELLAAEGQEVATGVEQTGRFSCSDPVLEGCFAAMIHTERSNMHSVPTDCPQRDERMAWLNDMTVRCEEAMFNFDVRLFYEKWLLDIADAQTPEGSIPDTAPHVYCGNPAFHVSSCFVLIPWLMYQLYGDDTMMHTLYEPMKRYVRFLASQRGTDGLIGPPYFGEWAPPAAECNPDSPWSAEPVHIPTGLIATGYLAYDCRLLAAMAERTGRAEDATAFRSLFRETADSLNAAYYQPEEGHYGGAQACDIFPLFLGIAPAPQRVFRHLLADRQAHGGHITTGNQMTKYWFEVLDAFGRNDVALQMASDTTYPSLGFMLANGATTLWERWENLDGSGMNSHNHPMNGACTVWYYKSLAGIRPDGEGCYTVTPAVELPIDWVNASVAAPGGRLAVLFWREEGGTVVDVTVPFNTRVALKLPSGNRPIVCNGQTVETAAGEDGYRTIPLSAGRYRCHILPV